MHAPSSLCCGCAGCCQLPGWYHRHSGCQASPGRLPQSAQGVLLASACAAPASAFPHACQPLGSNATQCMGNTNPHPSPSCPPQLLIWVRSSTRPHPGGACCGSAQRIRQRGVRGCQPVARAKGCPTMLSTLTKASLCNTCQLLFARLRSPVATSFPLPGFFTCPDHEVEGKAFHTAG